MLQATVLHQEQEKTKIQDGQCKKITFLQKSIIEYEQLNYDLKKDKKELDGQVSLLQSQLKLQE